MLSQIQKIFFGILYDNINQLLGCSAEDNKEIISNGSITNQESDLLINIYDDSFVLKRIHGGTLNYKSGSKVHIDSFFCSQIPVTQRLWKSIMRYNPSFFEGLNNPVENVNWLDAILFCNRLSSELSLEEYYIIDGETVSLKKGANGFRLPTYHEWIWCNDNSDNGNIEDYAWILSNSDNRTHPVGQLNANENGLYDFLGNVWEWCWNAKIVGNLYHTGEFFNPTEPNEGDMRICMGGAYNEKNVGARRSTSKGFEDNDCGLRVVCNEIVEDKTCTEVLTEEDIRIKLKKAKQHLNRKEYDSALFLFKILAANNCKEAFDNLGDIYYFGHGISKSIDRAESYYRKGAEAGIASSQLWLGQILMNRGENEEAFSWLLKSASQGQGWAQFLVGELYEKGMGTKRNMEQAIYWYRMSAKNHTNYYHRNSEEALVRLGIQVYENYMGEVSKVDVNMNMSAEEQYEQGHWWVFDERTPENFAYLIASAENGYPQAQKDLGDIYCSSDAQSYGFYDEVKSKEWYSRAFDGFMKLAKEGDMEAMEELGDMYRKGNGLVEKNIELAEMYYRIGAEKGHDGCQLWLGQVLREKGQMEEALKWLQKSGEQGQGWAAYLVGLMYENGEGAQRDRSKAVEWYTKSANTRNLYADNARSALRRLGEPVPDKEDDW